MIQYLYILIRYTLICVCVCVCLRAHVRAHACVSVGHFLDCWLWLLLCTADR